MVLNKNKGVNMSTEQSSQEIARKILASGDLEKTGYSLQDLFKIRDALNILNNYGFADLGLLLETNKYIEQKAKQ